MTISEIANKKGVIIIIGLPEDLSAAYAESIELMEMCGPFQILHAPYPEEKRDPFEDIKNSFEMFVEQMSFSMERIARATEHCKESITDETHISHHHPSMSKQSITKPYFSRKPPYNRRGHRQSYKPPPEQNRNK